MRASNFATCEHVWLEDKPKFQGVALVNLAVLPLVDSLRSNAEGAGQRAGVAAVSANRLCLRNTESLAHAASVSALL